MTHPENGKPLWSESRVESLLEDFFRKEMPQALRGSSPSPAPRRQFSSAQPSAAPRSQTARRRANSLAGLAMVGFSSLLMLMLAVVAWNHSSSGPNPEMHSTSPDGNRSESVGRESDPLKHTGDGPIEMRSRIQNVNTLDPPSNKRPAFPELDIEVFPLDGDSPSEPEKPRSRKPEHKPMPEENRQLPENAPPKSIDPDEALFDSVLPELAFG